MFKFNKILDKMKKIQYYKYIALTKIFGEEILLYKLLFKFE